MHEDNTRKDFPDPQNQYHMAYPEEEWADEEQYLEDEYPEEEESEEEETMATKSPLPMDPEEESEEEDTMAIEFPAPMETITLQKARKGRKRLRPNEEQEEESRAASKQELATNSQETATEEKAKDNLVQLQPSSTHHPTIHRNIDNLPKTDHILGNKDQRDNMTTQAHDMNMTEKNAHTT